MLTYLLFVVGFALLIKGADYLVEGSSSIAKRLGISDLVIGLTIVAFGTSMPELIVNIIASLRGNTDIAIGNIVGSNISNILLILGISALVYPLTVKKSTTWKEIPLSLLAVLVVFIEASDAWIEGASFSILSRIDGLILMAFFLVFMAYIIGMAKAEHESDGITPKFPLGRSVLMAFGGLAGLAIGGNWVVEGAIKMAKGLGVSESLIGLTIVAVGTSLPELATSAMASYKRKSDIAIGNIVGSNIFNIFWVLGLSATIKPLPFSQALGIDVAVCVAATLLLFVFCFTPKYRKILWTTESYGLGRIEGGILLAAYIVYITYLVMRG